MCFGNNASQSRLCPGMMLWKKQRWMFDAREKNNDAVKKIKVGAVKKTKVMLWKKQRCPGMMLWKKRTRGGCLWKTCATQTRICFENRRRLWRGNGRHGERSILFLTRRGVADATWTFGVEKDGTSEGNNGASGLFFAEIVFVFFWKTFYFGFAKKGFWLIIKRFSFYFCKRGGTFPRGGGAVSPKKKYPPGGTFFIFPAASKRNPLKLSVVRNLG